MSCHSMPTRKGSDKRPARPKALGNLYRIKCSVSPWKYVGVTGRRVECRKKEHSRSWLFATMSYSATSRDSSVRSAVGAGSWRQTGSGDQAPPTKLSATLVGFYISHFTFTCFLSATSLIDVCPPLPVISWPWARCADMKAHEIQASCHTILSQFFLPMITTKVLRNIRHLSWDLRSHQRFFHHLKRIKKENVLFRLTVK